MAPEAFSAEFVELVDLGKNGYGIVEVEEGVSVLVGKVDVA